MSETVDECECGSPFVFRVPSSFTTLTVEDRKTDRKVGEATKDGIEENRDILKKIRHRATTQEFEPNE